MADQKSRHGCLTAWLVFMVIANSLSSLFYLFGSASVKQALPNAPSWIFPVLVFMGLVNVVCAFALFMWKKWGFWGFCVSSVIALITNISAGIGASSIVGLIGVAILYGVLQIGQEDKGWPQLD